MYLAIRLCRRGPTWSHLQKNSLVLRTITLHFTQERYEFFFALLNVLQALPCLFHLLAVSLLFQANPAVVPSPNDGSERGLGDAFMNHEWNGAGHISAFDAAWLRLSQNVAPAGAIRNFTQCDGKPPLTSSTSLPTTLQAFFFFLFFNISYACPSLRHDAQTTLQATFGGKRYNPVGCRHCVHFPHDPPSDRPRKSYP